MTVGCMVWRIGGIVDFYEQIEWLRGHGFEAVSFWTCGGVEGEWEGFDGLRAGESEVRRLREALREFARVDLHAAATPTDAGGVTELERTLDFAGEIGADVVTMHDERMPGESEESVAERMRRVLPVLNRRAAKANVRVGLELTDNYALALRPDCERVGFTLDTGHVSMDGGAGYRGFGSIAGLIQHVGDRLFCVHVHDYDGRFDHLAIGAGCVDFASVVEALRRVRYDGVLCLEPNPERVSPEEILESRERLRAALSKSGDTEHCVPGGRRDARRTRL